MNKLIVIGLVLVTMLIMPASAFEFPRFDFNHLNNYRELCNIPYQRALLQH